MVKSILLVEPDFPFPNKSKNKANSVHKNFVPLGLLKLGSLHKDKGNKVKLVRGKKSEKEIGFVPNKILITSLFTYWSKYVWDNIEHYRGEFPKSEIELGGIYTTLHADTKKFKNLANKYRINISKGVNQEAEKYLPDYSLMPDIDYHATHMMRGCIRRCKFCGTWRLEPQMTRKTKENIIDELKRIGKNKVVFYDNNILANPQIKDLLKEFAELKIKGKPIIFESQSGFDGRLLERDFELVLLLKKARFQNVRIAWDNSVDDKDSIKKQINFLVKAGYPAKNISVFMIYNFNTAYEDMFKKLNFCKKLGVQITDCRYRPLELDYDNYNPHLRNGQPEGSFHIHKEAGWTDWKIRDFRKQVRQHNIWIRYAKDKGLKYNNKMEKWSAIHNTYKFFNLGRPPQMEIIENNSRIYKRIMFLNRLANYHKKFNIEPPNLSNIPLRNLDKLLKNLFEVKIRKSQENEGILRSVLSNLNDNKALI
jgi:pyruvate-formate lyase-activating enzyme